MYILAFLWFLFPPSIFRVDFPSLFFWIFDFFSQDFWIWIFDNSYREGNSTVGLLVFFHFPLPSFNTFSFAFLCLKTKCRDGNYRFPFLLPFVHFFFFPFPFFFFFPCLFILSHFPFSSSLLISLPCFWIFDFFSPHLRGGGTPEYTPLYISDENGLIY